MKRRWVSLLLCAVLTLQSVGLPALPAGAEEVYDDGQYIEPEEQEEDINIIDDSEIDVVEEQAASSEDSSSLDEGTDAADEAVDFDEAGDLFDEGTAEDVDAESFDILSTAETEQDTSDDGDDLIDFETEEEEAQSLLSSASTSGSCGLSVTWRYDSGTLTISGIGEMYTYYELVNIDDGEDDDDETGEDDTVVAEGASPWEDLQDSIQKVVIEDGVTNISTYAFGNCSNLTTVEIGDSVQTIGSDAFFFCENLSSLTIGKSVTTIGDGAFDNCGNDDGGGLTEVVLPDSVTTIGEYAFDNCVSLKTIEIGSGLTMIGAGAFINCESLEEIKLPKGVSYIGSYAFEQCTSLKYIHFAGAVAYIGEDIFCDDSLTVGYPRGSAFWENYIDAGEMLGASEIEWLPETSTSITLEPSIDAYIGETFTISADITHEEDVSNALPVTWTVDDPDGLVLNTPPSEVNTITTAVSSITAKAVKAGTYIVTATTADEISASTTVVVDGTKIEFWEESYTFYMGDDELLLKATVTNLQDISSALPITWTVNDSTGLEIGESVELEDSNGKGAIVFASLLPKAVGQYTVTATSSDGVSVSVPVDIYDAKIELEKDYYAYVSDCADGEFQVVASITTEDCDIDDVLPVTWTVEDENALEVKDHLELILSKNSCDAYVKLVPKQSGEYKVTVETGDGVSASTTIHILEWEVKNEVLTISGESEMENFDEDHEAPWCIWSADNPNTYWSSIDIADGVKNLGNYAFYTWYQCDQLDEVKIGKDVTSIGAYALAINWGNASDTHEAIIEFEGDAPNIDANAFGKFYFNVRYDDTYDGWEMLIANSHFTEANLAWVKKTDVIDLISEKETWNLQNDAKYLGSDYVMLEEEREKLFAALSKSDQAVVNDKIKEVYSGAFGGLCYGMNSILALSKLGRISVSAALGGTASRLCNVYNGSTVPDKVRSVLYFYQLLQDTPALSDLQASFQKLTQKKQLEKLEEEVEWAQTNHAVALIGINYTSGGQGKGHELAGYAIEQGTFFVCVNGVEYQFNKRILIYDPAKLGEDQQYFSTAIYYDTEACIWVMAGLYQCVSSSNQFVVGSQDDNAMLCHVYTNWQVLDAIDVVSGQVNYSGTNWFGYAYSASKAFTLKSTSGTDQVTNGLFNGTSTASSSGNIIIPDSKGMGAAAGTLTTIALSDLMNEYTISSDETLDCSLLYADCYLDASSDAGGEVEFSPDGSVTVTTSEAANTTVEITKDEPFTSLDLNTVSITSSECTELSAAPSEDGVVISGDNLSLVTINAEEADGSTDEITISAEANHIAVKTEEDGTIEVLADTDGDGEYESEVYHEETRILSEIFLADCVISVAENGCVYIGAQIKPSVTVKRTDGRTLTETQDYSVAYSNNVNVGTASVTVTGVGRYIGTQTLTFAIHRASLSSAVLSANSYTYDGAAKKPAVTVKDSSGKTLTSGTDYTVSYSSNVNVGTATVTITGKGNYTGTLKKTFTINKASLASAALASTSYTYDGTAKKPAVTVKNSSGKTLTQGTDYTVSYSSNVNVGTAAVTITGKGNYTGTIKKTFTISKASLASAALSASSYSYDGSARKPAVTVKNSSGKTLTLGTDYAVSYSGNVGVGTAAATVTGTGNYAGTIKKTFTINPMSTSIKSLKPKSKGFTVKWTKKTKQVTGYEIQYSTSSKFKKSVTKTKSVKGAKKVSKAISGLKAKKKYYVRIRTYKTVGGITYYSDWSAKKTVTTK